MYPRVLTVQDISCLGQCSLTVALPIISACACECCILPSAVLSTHTGGFTGFTFRDLSEDIPKIREHWQKEGISFDGIYTGYLGSERQIDMVVDLFRNVAREGALCIVDPAMGDHGALYTGFDMNYAHAMARLCGEADVILPNVTEACFMTDTPYSETFDKEWIEMLLSRLFALGAPRVVLTGVAYTEGKTGVLVATKDGERFHYEHEKVGKGYHGTGDVYASAFTGALMQGKSAEDAACLAADFTVAAIRATVGDDSHPYGVKFEKVLSRLTCEFGDK